MGLLVQQELFDTTTLETVSRVRVPNVRRSVPTPDVYTPDIFQHSGVYLTKESGQLQPGDKPQTDLPALEDSAISNFRRAIGRIVADKKLDPNKNQKVLQNIFGVETPEDLDTHLRRFKPGSQSKLNHPRKIKPESLSPSDVAQFFGPTLGGRPDRGTLFQRAEILDPNCIEAYAEFAETKHLAFKNIAFHFFHGVLNFTDDQLQQVFQIAEIGQVRGLMSSLPLNLEATLDNDPFFLLTNSDEIFGNGRLAEAFQNALVDISNNFGIEGFIGHDMPRELVNRLRLKALQTLGHEMNKRDLSETSIGLIRSNLEDILFTIDNSLKFLCSFDWTRLQSTEGYHDVNWHRKIQIRPTIIANLDLGKPNFYDSLKNFGNDFNGLLQTLSEYAMEFANIYRLDFHKMAQNLKLNVELAIGVQTNFSPDMIIAGEELTIFSLQTSKMPYEFGVRMSSLVKILNSVIYFANGFKVPRGKDVFVSSYTDPTSLLDMISGTLLINFNPQNGDLEKDRINSDEVLNLLAYLGFQVETEIVHKNDLAAIRGEIPEL